MTSKPPHQNLTIARVHTSPHSPSLVLPPSRSSLPSARHVRLWHMRSHGAGNPAGSRSTLRQLQPHTHERDRGFSRPDHREHCDDWSSCMQCSLINPLSTKDMHQKLFLSSQHMFVRLIHPFEPRNRALSCESCNFNTLRGPVPVIQTLI